MKTRTSVVRKPLASILVGFKSGPFASSIDVAVHKELDRGSRPCRICMDASLFTLGAGAPDAALLLNRVALGLFFSISGYQKLFNAARHASLTRTLQDDGVRAVPIMEWLVPAVEFSGGCALLIGLLSALAAFGLCVICLGAVALDAVKRIGALQPINRLDVVDDLLYLPESLYCVGLGVVVLAGPGRWSLDAVIAMQSWA